MRADAQGLFWNEIPAKVERQHDYLIKEGWVLIKSGFWIDQFTYDNEDYIDYEKDLKHEDHAYLIARENKKAAVCIPPNPVWLGDNYLPGLDEALQFNVDLFTDNELIRASEEGMFTYEKHVLIFDVESYYNYFLIAFKSPTLGKVVYLESYDGTQLNVKKLNWIFDRFLVVGFNSKNYDLPVCAVALSQIDSDTQPMKLATNMIIRDGYRPYQILRQFGCRVIDTNHIDLIELAPLRASLKIYGGRLHTRKMQDLPFAPDKFLTPEQVAITRLYCINDLNVTIDLYNEVKPELDLRVRMSETYLTDLRSKSDAQIAETVITKAVENLNGFKARAPQIDAGQACHYVVPDFIRYTSTLLAGMLDIVAQVPFVVGESGAIGLPQTLKDLELTIGTSTYRMGIGGLHSSEKATKHFADDNTILVDRDVTSYYPFIILNQKLFPHHLTDNFLTVYRDIVEQRIAAKRSGDKVTADALKITINGTFGKLGSRFSSLYSPDLLTQVTITGQLSLLMLIERLEFVNIPVVSANTDGIVIKCPIQLQPQMDDVIKQWELDTNFETEASHYKAIYSRDVNNYIAIPIDDDKPIKGKGIFAEVDIRKNPQNRIVIKAIIQLLRHEIPIRQTIQDCKDIRQFINVRKVKGGAVKLYKEGEDGLYLGTAIRWYYATNQTGDIVYASNGKKVPKSDGAKPLMQLPDTFPNDIDYKRYEIEADKILKSMGLQ